MVQVSIGNHTITAYREERYRNLSHWLDSAYKKDNSIATMMIRPNRYGRYTSTRLVTIPHKVTTKKALLLMIKKMIVLVSYDMGMTGDKIIESAHKLGVRLTRGIISSSPDVSIGTPEEFVAGKTILTFLSYLNDCRSFISQFFSDRQSGGNYTTEQRFRELVELDKTIDTMIEALENMEEDTGLDKIDKRPEALI